MPKRNHNYFLPGSLDEGFKQWFSEYTPLLHHVLQDRPLQPCVAQHALPSWIDAQMSQFLHSLSHALHSLCKLNPIGSILFSKDPLLLHCMPQFYKALRFLKGPTYPDYLTRWELDLRSTLMGNQKDKIMQLSHISCISSKMEEVNYTQLTQWNDAPGKLHAMFPTSSSLYWRECGGYTKHTHIYTNTHSGEMWSTRSLLYKVIIFVTSPGRFYFIVQQNQ